MQPAAVPDFAIPACFLIAEQQEDVRLSDCSISVDVRSRIAIIEQMQEFHNLSDQVQEVTYAFPDGGDGVFLEMIANLDGQKVVLDVRKTQEAEQAYEKARNEGNLPVLAKNLGENVNCICLGKLAAGARVQVTSRFAAPIKFIGARGQLRIPTTIAPRYGINRDPERAQAMPDASLLVEHPLRLSVAVSGAMRNLDVSCPSHQLKTVSPENGAENGGERKCKMLFEDAYKDRDIVLLFSGQPPESMGIAVKNPFADGPGRVVWLDLLAGPAEEQRPKNIHFLIDCSGSMSGDGNRLAGEFLKSFAPLISGQDTVGLSIFGSNYRLLFSGRPGSQVKESDLVSAAHNNLGGTALGRALDQTLTERHEGADIVLVTDGHVHEGAELVERLHKKNCRIFAIGIGSSPRQTLLESLARATEGSCDFLSAGMESDGVAKSCAQLAATGRRRITAVSWPDEGKPEWCSPLPQTIHPDVPLPVVAFFAGAKAPQQATVVIDGKESLVGIDDLGDSRGRELSKLAALRRHNSSCDEGESLQIALAYGLVTEATSLVGVIKPAEKMLGESASTVIRPMLAAGWGGFGTAFNGAEDHASVSCPDYQQDSIVNKCLPADPMHPDSSPDHMATPMHQAGCFAAKDSFLLDKMDMVADYRRDSRQYASTGRLPTPRKRISLPPLTSPQLIRISAAAPEKELLHPQRFLQAMKGNKQISEKLAAMGEFLQELCRQIASKDEDRFCTVLESVVDARLQNGPTPEFDEQARLDKFLAELFWGILPANPEQKPWSNSQLPEHGLVRFLAARETDEKLAVMGGFLQGMYRQISGDDAERFCKALDAVVQAKVKNEPEPKIDEQSEMEPLLRKLFHVIFPGNLDKESWQNPSLPGRCPARFLAAETTADKMAAMSSFLKGLCRQIAKDNEDCFCSALQTVVLARLQNSRLPKFDELAELDRQFFEQLLHSLLAPHLPAESWRMGWPRFFDALKMDAQVGKMTFTLDMRKGPQPQ